MACQGALGKVTQSVITQKEVRTGELGRWGDKRESDLNTTGTEATKETHPLRSSGSAQGESAYRGSRREAQVKEGRGQRTSLVTGAVRGTLLSECLAYAMTKATYRRKHFI